jgi:hypothetical protein
VTDLPSVDADEILTDGQPETRPGTLRERERGQQRKGREDERVWVAALVRVSEVRWGLRFMRRSHGASV